MDILPKTLIIMKKRKILLLVILTIVSFIIFSMIFRNWELIKGWFI